MRNVIYFISKRGKPFNLAVLIFFVLLSTTEVFCESPKTPPDWQLKMKWEKVPLSEIPISDTRIKVMDGYADGVLTIYNAQLSNEASYKAEGNIDKCKIYLPEWDKKIEQISGSFIIKDKELKINSLEGQFQDIPFNAQADINLTSPYPFNAKIKAKGVMLEEISQFLPFLKNYGMIKTPSEAEFNIKGVLPPGSFEGTAILQTVFFYSILMSNVEISFVWDDNKITVKNVSANLGEGTIILKQRSSE